MSFSIQKMNPLRLTGYGFLILLLALAGRSFYNGITHRKIEARIVTARGELANDEKATIKIFENASPSVVYITTMPRVTDPWRRNVFSAPTGTGSGFIWDGKGHVVTNFHVIRKASSAKIRLNDDRVFDAELIGVSPEHDLAVLRIETAFSIPPPVPIGSSSELLVGQKVFAIGNPFGLDYTLTSGIISALDRNISGEDEQTIENLIQTDAAINPGNSGGPLLDSAGRLIGINTAIFSPSGASAGIGFAVPVDTVNRVVPRLIGKGRYDLPELGTKTNKQINRLVKQRFGIEGVAVLYVESNSIAERLTLKPGVYDSTRGFQLGDVILELNGRKVKNTVDIGHALEKQGERATLMAKVWRNGGVVELKTGYSLR